MRWHHNIYCWWSHTTVYYDLKENIIEYLKGLNIENESFKQGLEELKYVAKYLVAFGVPEEYFRIDLSIARGLDYYTGTVYETVVDAMPELGSVCSGGRYENLAEYYTNKRLPGVGISIGLSMIRIIYKFSILYYLIPGYILSLALSIIWGLFFYVLEKNLNRLFESRQQLLLTIYNMYKFDTKCYIIWL